MAILRLSEGPPEIHRLLVEGKKISEFLTSPYTPCYIYGKDGQLIAINEGAYDSEFKTYVSDNCRDIPTVKFIYEYMCKTPDARYAFWKVGGIVPINVHEQIRMRGFSKLVFEGGTANDILSELSEEENFIILGEMGKSKDEYHAVWNSREQELRKRKKDLEEYYGHTFTF